MTSQVFICASRDPIPPPAAYCQRYLQRAPEAQGYLTARRPLRIDV